MARNYSYCSNASNAASSSVPMATIISTANIRPKVYEVGIGSDASPGDQAAKYALQRCTSTGTPGSSPTAAPLDIADPAAQVTCGLAVFSVNPTLTAGAIPWQVAINQRATYRWLAKDGYEIVMPATASNGLALMPLVCTSGGYNVDFSLVWAE